MADSFTVHFIASYWRYVLGVILPLLVLYVIRSFFTRKRVTLETNRPPSGLPEEHPLAEFRDTQPTDKGKGLFTSPLSPLHAEDTEQIPYVHVEHTEEEMIQRSQEFYKLMNSRRSVRMFSQQPVPIEVIRNIVHTAGTAPSGKDPNTYNCMFLYFLSHL